MDNALDYMAWRGDIPFSFDGFNEIDMLIFAELVYAPLENYSHSFSVNAGQGPELPSIFRTVYPSALPKKTSYVFKPRYDLWSMLESHPRFSGVRLDRFVSNFEPENDKQFAAAVFCCEFNGKKHAVVSFRGTDSTVTGWKEDFDMAYKFPIPAQADSVAFLDSVLGAGYDSVDVCGHSKGGNLAMYAAASCSAPDSICGVYNFDGPGLQESFFLSDAWKGLQPRIRSFIPESSIIGMLMGRGTMPVIVESDSKSIMQHNPFYWHVIGTHFVEADDTTVSSRFLDGTLHRFLDSCTLEQKEVLVRTVFQIIEISEADKVKDIPKGLVKHLPKARRIISEIPEKDRKLISETLKILVGSGSITAKLLLGKEDTVNENP